MNQKKVLLIQFRKDEDAIRHEQECILRGLGTKKDFIEVVNFFDEGNSSSDKINLSEIKGVIIGGSGEFSFSDKEKKIELWKNVQSSFSFIKNIMEGELPILGICFGHQFLGYLLGSEVVNDRNQEETGSFKIRLTEDGLKDSLFEGLPQEFIVQEGHKDCLFKLPEGAVLLASSKKCNIEAFRFNNTYGVQFHPELEMDDVNFRLSKYPDYAEGKIAISISLSPFTKKILQNFSVIIDK